jgi:nucleotidyltransferase substrate binding protein (TIGR01987 family)
LALELTSLRKAINSLERALAVARIEIVGPVDSDREEVIRAGVIQNFELAYELCWKFMKRWLETNLSSDAVDGLSMKELFRLSAERKLIDRVEPWFSYHLHRNKTSHTYEHATANEVFASSVDFLADAKSFLKNLESKND